MLWVQCYDKNRTTIYITKIKNGRAIPVIPLPALSYVQWLGRRTILALHSAIRTSDRNIYAEGEERRWLNDGARNGQVNLKMVERTSSSGEYHCSARYAAFHLCRPVDALIVM